jgi:guanylate kinase
MKEAIKDKYKIIALFGKSGSGKDTIKNWLVSLPNTNKIINTTTRPKRDYEIDKKDYYFISPLAFIKNVAQKEFIEYEVFNGWYYGTQKIALKKENINIGVFNISSIHQMLKREELEVLPILIDVPDEIRFKRIIEREKNPNYSEIWRRFLTDKEDFQNLDFSYETFINNSDNKDFSNIQNIPTIKKFFGKLT